VLVLTDAAGGVLSATIAHGTGTRKENTMSQVNVVRAWKDEEYRLGLTEAERAALPENPAGLVELAADELGSVAGGDDWLTTGNG
jgi:mersacidin/lichenicidin family type 2 lantibiotic